MDSCVIWENSTRLDQELLVLKLQINAITKLMDSCAIWENSTRLNVILLCGIKGASSRILKV